MEKTKLGVSVSLAAALLYISGLFGYVPMILCAGYVLLAEPSRDLKQHAFKLLAFMSVLAIITALMSSLDSAFGLINTVVGWTGVSFRFRMPLNVDSIIAYAVQIVTRIGLVFMALQAYNGKTVEIKAFDKFFPNNTAE